MSINSFTGVDSLYNVQKIGKLILTELHIYVQRKIKLRFETRISIITSMHLSFLDAPDTTYVQVYNSSILKCIRRAINFGKHVKC